MEYITMKNSDLKVSRLCMGGCPMGGYGWGDTHESDFIDAVHTALDVGVNLFDTADTYGLGQSEKTLGKALQGRRDHAVIASKFGVRVENGATFYDNTPRWIRTACENSLTRLNTDYIDLYQIHYRDGVTPLADVVETLEQLRQEGKIRYYGLSNLHAGDLQELEVYKGRFTSLQDEYSLACRKNEKDLMSICSEIQLTPLTWGSLGQGILTGKYHAGNVDFPENDRRSRPIYVNFHGEKLKKNLKIVDKMREISDKYQKSVPAVAIRFILDYIPESIVLCGAKNPSQVRGNSEGTGWKLDEKDINILETISSEM